MSTPAELGGALYQWVAMPMGLANSSAAFQRTIDHVLGGLHKFCAAYVDDIVIFSQTMEEHIGHVREVMDRLKEHAIVPKSSKAQMMQTCIELLGHMVTGATDNRPTSVAPQSKKIDTVAQWPVPKSAAHVR